jgi:cardiolipin synthase
MSPTWRDGNRVALLENGEAFFPRVWEVLAAARESVLVETFILGDDEVGRQLVETLCALADRGVRVAMMADGFGSDRLPADAVAALDQAGVRLVLFEPWRRLLGVRTNLFRRMHRKTVVVDDRIAFLGGINFCADHLRSSGEKSLQDYALEVEGPVVADVGHYLREVWAGDTPVRRRRWRFWHRRPAPASPPGAEAALAAFVVRDNDEHRTDIERAYRLAIRTAQTEVLIANAYFFPGYRFLRDLRDAARRGVRVVLVVQGKPDLRIVTFGLRWLYHFLVPAGIWVREFGERPLHAKIAVVDRRWATVGSSNLDPLSLSLNLEANLLVDDAAFAAQVRDAVLALVRRPGRWVLKSDVPRVTWWQRPMAALVFHFLRHFPAWAGWIPAHRSRLDEVSGAGEIPSAQPPRPLEYTGAAPRHAWRWIGLAIALTVLTLLTRHLWTVEWSEVWRLMTDTPRQTLLAACGVALTGHAIYGLQDVVSARVLRHGLARARSWLSGVVCYVLGLNVGALLGAVVSKLAVYRRQGVPTEAAAQVVTLGILGNWSAWVLLLAWALNTESVSQGLARSDLLPTWLPSVSWLLVALVIGYFVACARGVVPRFRERRLQLPPARLAALQTLVGVASWLTVAAVLHLCLDGVTRYPETLAVMLVAAVAGAVAHVPGGWGVLEFVVVAVLAGRASTAQLLAAVLLFRIAYYLLPLALALPAYAGWLRREGGLVEKGNDDTAQTAKPGASWKVGDA